jgi:hypothetical protein
MMMIKISCLQGPENHVRSLLDHDHGDVNDDDEETTGGKSSLSYAKNRKNLRKYWRAHVTTLSNCTQRR